MTRLTSFLAGSALALTLAALPFSAQLGQAGISIKTAAAFAKDGGSGGSGSGRGGSDDGGGHGRGGDDGGNRGGDDNGGNRGNDDPPGDDNGGRHGAHHIDSATGAKVEVSRNSIEVRHANGVKEELENGRYEMKDARGRTIVERTATAEDIARMNGLAN